MHGKVILISDDTDFFEYIIPKLSLRNSDELCKFGFADLPDIAHLLNDSVLIVNSEDNSEKTLDLLDIVTDSPIIVFSYNEDEQFKIKAYNKGMFAYFTLSASPQEIDAQLTPALKIISSQHKNNIYRELLVKNNLITENNEVFLDFSTVLDKQLDNINKTTSKAVLIAISPDDDSKLLISSNKIETLILNNIRENDVLMNYSANKYFLLLHNIDVDNAKKLWNKISTNMPDGIYAGFASVENKSRQQLVNEVLNNLYKSMNNYFLTKSADNYDNNFKSFKIEFTKKFEQIIAPLFYKMQQIYDGKFLGIKIEHELGEGYAMFCLKSQNANGILRITYPGHSAINIDISYEGTTDAEDKRINLEPEELEEGLLSDILEQFILEFKNLNNGEEYDYTE